MLTSDPIYNKPYKPKITIKDVGGTNTYYTYNPWTDSGTTNKPTHCSLAISENTHGKFVVQIEDGGRTLNRSNINKGARVIIEVGKQSTQMTPVISGLVRESGDGRGSDRKDLYTLSGSSTSIRVNERIIYFVRQAIKLAQDGMTIDINDPAMKAVILLAEGFQSTRSVRPLAVGAEGSLGVINITNLVTNSQVRNFIADINIEFGELQDLVNVIEEQSGSEFIFSSADIANLRYELNRIQGGRGFTIKNKTYRISGIDDDADDTMYLIRKNWKYSESVYKSDSYSNVLSGIYPSEPEPSTTADIGFTQGYGGNNYNWLSPPGVNQEHAAKFRPPHSHFINGDIFVAISTFTHLTAPPWTIPVFRIVKDQGGVPMDSGGTVVSITFPADQFGGRDNNQTVIIPRVYYFQDAGGSVIQSFDLDTTKDYWLMLSDDNSGNSGGTSYYTNWKDNIFINATRAFRNSGSPSSLSSGGTGWSVSSGNRFCFGFPRRRSEVIVAHDPKAIKNLGSGLLTGGTPIESNLPSFPSIIKTKQAGYSYMANQLYYMAKPRANYQMPQVTAPNIPPMPGDPLIISDTVLGFSTPGNRVVFTRCGDLSLSWGTLDGSGFTYEAPTKLSVNPVGTVPRYK